MGSMKTGGKHLGADYLSNIQSNHQELIGIKKWMFE